MPTPLLIHLIFHPASTSARALAFELHRTLNDDSILPGLRVPTIIACEDGTGLPPIRHDLDEADRNVVIVLADDEMVVEPLTIPQDRQTWAHFVSGLWKQCEDSRQRFIPVQLSQNAWPLDPLLEGTSFLRAVLQPEASRTAWLIRSVVVEICRYLQGEDRGERLPLRLFLSHAKQDISASPKIFDAIVAHLQTTSPVKTWIDSADIEGGSRFSDEIEKGVLDSVLLVLATRNYNSRPWCRKELLLAKRHQRPFVIIDALEGLDLRSFPYGGNAPRLRWADGGAPKAVDLLLKETLRHLHVRLVLEQQKLDDDVVLSAPPELTTVVRIPRGATVLYPDPPLGDEEMDELKPLELRIETPLQRAAQSRRLSRVPIVISISETGDAEHHGLFAVQLDAALVEIARQLLVRGASLEYGGDLRSAGYTLALFDMAKAYSALSGLPSAERIINDVGWPSPLMALSAAERAKHQMVATYRRIPRPSGVEALDPTTFVEEPIRFPADSAERRYAWARGMTAMREFQAKTAKARIVIGGKIGGPLPVAPGGKRVTKWYSGRIPGVVEEVLLSLKAGQPLYLIGSFGGAAAMAIDLLEGKPRSEFTWEYQRNAPHSDGMQALYEKQGPAWEDYPEMAEQFKAWGVAELVRRNGLTMEENRELFQGRDLTRIVELILEGITRVGTTGVGD